MSEWVDQGGPASSRDNVGVATIPIPDQTPKSSEEGEEEKNIKRASLLEWTPPQVESATHITTGSLTRGGGVSLRARSEASEGGPATVTSGASMMALIVVLVSRRCKV